MAKMPLKRSDLMFFPLLCRAENKLMSGYNIKDNTTINNNTTVLHICIQVTTVYK